MSESSGLDHQTDEGSRSEERTSRTRRAYEEIRLWGDPVLRSPASSVVDFGTLLEAQADHMIQVMLDAPGCGLAAPQIGSLRRLLVYQLPSAEDEDPPPQALVNPEIVEASDEQELFLEGCLSIPGIYVAIERSRRIVARARDPLGGPVEMEATGRLASILQHEIDHLDGVLLPDRLSAADRKAFMRAVREAVASGWTMEETLVGSAVELVPARSASEPQDEVEGSG